MIFLIYGKILIDGNGPIKDYFNYWKMWDIIKKTNKSIILNIIILVLNFGIKRIIYAFKSLFLIIIFGHLGQKKGDIFYWL